MANTFKNAIKSNVNNGSYHPLYTAPSSTTSIILGLALANKTTSAVTVKVQITDAAPSGTIQLLEDVSIPANTTLEVLGGQKYVLEAEDILKVQAGTGTAIDAFLGVMERT
tara:strand:+ start:2182 stop:2514 length:333 start_codon:yes stop_codon:yes gene_type:complete